MKKLLVLGLLLSFTSTAFAFSKKEDRIEATKLCAKQCNISQESAAKCNMMTQGQYMKGQVITHDQRRCMKDCLQQQEDQYEELYAN